MSEYPIVDIDPNWVLKPEAMGSKTKFWYRSPDEEVEWLFKYPQHGTGQHWAEKIAAEVAAKLEISHAPVELASFQGVEGSATRSFVRDGRQLFHGNQILAGQVSGYSRDAKFGHCGHTWANICLAMDRVALVVKTAEDGKRRLAEYLTLDAVIGNVDRHHENWGLVLKRLEDRWRGGVAPSFDHASSLGRELRDERRQRFLDEGRVGQYVEKGAGAVYWEDAGTKGPSPLELVRKAVAAEPTRWQPALLKLERLEDADLRAIVSKIPKAWMSDTARAFALALMCYCHKELSALSQ